MSQDDRISGPLREDQFAFLEKRGSCRCSGVTSTVANNSSVKEKNLQQTNTDDREIDDFVMSNDENDDAPKDSHRQHGDFERFGIVRSSTVEVQSVMSHVGAKILTRNCKKFVNDVAENETNDDANASIDKTTLQTSGSTIAINNSRQSSASMDHAHGPNDTDVPTKDRSINEPTTTDLTTSTTGRNDERSSTAASTVSFANSCSSTEANNSRNHGRNETNETIHRNLSSNVQQQIAVVNAFNGNRSNLRSMRDCNRTNVEGNVEMEEDNRAVENRNNGVSNYSPSGFHNLGEHIIMQPIHRGSGVPAKGNFETIQLSTDDTMEKGKCQCHHIQQHQHQQRLPNIQQRDQIHQHHHHQHRHKTMQTQQQQQSQRSQQTAQHHYRHHHYHHPHQHIGQQQQDMQRQTSDQLVVRNKRGGAGPDDECDDMIETSLGTHQPPALPPRPPPRPNRRYEHNNIAAYDLGPDNGDDRGCCKKYVVLCCLCGGLSAAVGSLFLAVHAVLSAHTASLALFETVPSYIPGTMLILMGIFTILLARRKHRYGFLMKLCGSVGVVCALVCVLVTVTTTVVHMSRLQGLQKCIYTKLARSCTCYYGPGQGETADPGVLFEETPHCEAVHGALHGCLRALFGVSVAGILACIFSCMLLYQLLSHEKKKMYWEQLQLRCRSLYGQGGSGAVGVTAGGSCGCCHDCGGETPWWAQTFGNIYTPNPDLAPFRRWRLPWSRSRGPAPTPDSNYGFHGQSRGAVMMRSSGSSGDIGDNAPGPYSVLTDDSQQGAPYSLLNSSGTGPYAACASSVASYSLLENGTLPAIWGPPPPYSDPNSPARRPQLTENRRPPASNRSYTPTQTFGYPVNVSFNRIANKRIADNFENGNSDEYRQQRGTPKRPSDNYENAEEVLSSGTDQEIDIGNLHQHHPHHHHPQHQQDDDSVKARRIRKSLKGVENGGFQQESNNPLSKQSESELYFGDVSSCCGPESSFYDLAVEKEQQSVPVDADDNTLEYPTPSRQTKHQRQPSKRSRMPLPLPVANSEPQVASPTESYTITTGPTDVNDETARNVTTRGPFLAPDAQYEVIAQQTRYTYYNSKNGEHVLEIPLPSLASLGYRKNSKPQIDETDGSTIVDYQNDCSPRLVEQFANDDDVTVPTTNNNSSSMGSSSPGSPANHCSMTDERSTNDVDANAWQNDQSRSQSSPDACPVNV